MDERVTALDRYGYGHEAIIREEGGGWTVRYLLVLNGLNMGADKFHPYDFFYWNLTDAMRHYIALASVVAFHNQR